jgi:excisionase family DNA binding protein
LHINRSTLYPLLMTGAIPSILIGRARRIPKAALEDWINFQLGHHAREGLRPVSCSV